jgi:hypothetical protein
MVDGLAANPIRKSLHRKSRPLIDEQRVQEAVVDAGRERHVRLTAVQRSEKARVEAERNSAVKLTVEHKFENARFEVDRRTGKSSQAAAIRLIDKRHCYVTRSSTVADRVVPTNVLVLGRENKCFSTKKCSS